MKGGVFMPSPRGAVFRKLAGQRIWRPGATAVRRLRRADW